MNYCDIIVIAIIAISAIVGLFSGFIMGLYRLASWFASIFLAIKLAEPLSKYLAETGLFNSIQEAIAKLIPLNNIDVSAISTMSQAEIVQALEAVPIPEDIKFNIAEKIPEMLEGITTNFANASQALGAQITSFIMLILCVVVLFIVLKIVFSLLGTLIKGISKLPIIKQVDKLGGFIIGALIGVLLVFVVMTTLILFNTLPIIVPVYADIQQSSIALFLYENNIFAEWLLPLIGKA